MPGEFFSKRNILFDLDGTLVDSAPAHARAYHEALRANHPEIASHFDYAQVAGQPTRQAFLHLGIGDGPELAALTARKQHLYREALARGEVHSFPGTEPMLFQLEKNGRKLFLVSGANRASVPLVLEKTGLRKYFSGIVVAEDTPLGKPSPEPYLHALAAFHLPAVDCLVVEDAASGIASAQAAGLDAVLLHTPLQMPGVLNVGACEKLLALLLP